MQLKLIQQGLAAYKNFLPTPAAQARLYAWESQRIFQQHWDADATDFGEMYDRSLDNSQTRRLWKRENYETKQMMQAFIALAPDMVRHAFLDLYNEEKDSAARADRFVFYCDELLRAYREKYPLSVENNHYHDDSYGMIALYLAFHYPERYTLCDFAAFRTLLQQLGSPDVPVANDFARFCKVTRTLYGFMQKDPELLSLHRQRLQPARHYIGESLLVVWDFYQFCAYG